NNLVDDSVHWFAFPATTIPPSTPASATSGAHQGRTVKISWRGPSRLAGRRWRGGMAGIVPRVHRVGGLANKRDPAVSSNSGDRASLGVNKPKLDAEHLGDALQ